MPSQRHHEPGDLYVKLSVAFPETIPLESIPFLERALPPRKPMEQHDGNVLVEEVHLNDVDRTRRDMRDDPMDEDTEAEPRVHCANQ